MLFPPSFIPSHTLLNLDGSSGSPSPPTSIYSLIHDPTTTQPSNPANPPRKILLLLHGYPQNRDLWYELIARLGEKVLEEYTVVIPDLPGYGLSTKSPSPDGSHFAHSKKAVASDMVQLLDIKFGKGCKFLVVGHDRGARVAYRIAKDYGGEGGRCLGVCLQDIVPTRYVFDKMTLQNHHKETFGSYHWIFLGLPSPLPETLIGNDPNFYMTHTIDSWTGTNLKGKLNAEAMKSWVSQYDDPNVVTGALEDYRAGANIDCEHDLLDEQAGKDGVECSLLVLYSAHLSRRFDVEGVWTKLARGAFRSVQIGDEGTGHFLPVEAPEQTTNEVVQWMEGIKLE